MLLPSNRSLLNHISCLRVEDQKQFESFFFGAKGHGLNVDTRCYHGVCWGGELNGSTAKVWTPA